MRESGSQGVARAAEARYRRLAMAREGVVALLEREVELGALSELASATLRGSGGLLVLEGPRAWARRVC